MSINKYIPPPDVECPNCGEGQEICHDDGQGYAEDEAHQQECWKCEKTFVFYTSISFYYEASEAPCLNGENHKWNETSYDYSYLNKGDGKNILHSKRCEWCDEQEREWAKE